MPEPRKSRDKLAAGDAEVEAIKSWIEKWRGDSEGRLRRELEIYRSLEGTDADRLRELAAGWQTRAETYKEFAGLTERYAYAVKPFADLGWAIMEADLKLGATRKTRTMARYAAAASVIARQHIEASPERAKREGWPGLVRAVRSHPNAPQWLPGSDRAIINQLRALGVTPEMEASA